MITGRSTERAREVAGDVRGAIGVGLDTRNEAQVEEVVAALWRDLGGIDLLVNNAGIGMRTVNPAFVTHPQGFWRSRPRGSATSSTRT